MTTENGTNLCALKLTLPASKPLTKLCDEFSTATEICDLTALSASP